MIEKMGAIALFMAVCSVAFFLLCSRGFKNFKTNASLSSFFNGMDDEHDREFEYPDCKRPVEGRNRISDRDPVASRIHHLWLRSLAINDERDAIFHEACALYGVDPDVDEHERAFIEDVFWHNGNGITPGIAKIRIDEYRLDQCADN